MKFRSLFIVMIGLLLMSFTTLAQDAGELIAPIYAQGSGMIALNGEGDITLTGQGILFIVDRSGKAQIDITGTGRPYERSSRGSRVIRYARFDGTVTLSGKDIALVLDGDTTAFVADMDGRLFFKGEGDYSSDDDSHQWTKMGVTISSDSDHHLRK